MSRTLLPRIAALLSALMLLAACSSGGGEGPLVVYSGRSEDLVGPLVERFEAETGIDVEVRYGDSTELAATLLAEGDQTEADVFFAQDPASLGSVVSLMQELPSEITDAVPARFRDTDGLWVGTSGRARVLVYDTARVADSDLPGGVDDMTDPVWNGVLGIAPTNGSFLAFVAAMILDEGAEETRSWLEAIAANDPVDYPGNSAIVQGAENGEVAAGLVNHYYLLRAEAEGAGEGLENHFFTSGDAASLVMPAGAAITTDTDELDDATAFVEFLLSTESQTYFAEETFEYPVISSVPASDRLPALDSIATPDIDLSELAGALDQATDLVAEAGLI